MWRDYRQKSKKYRSSSLYILVWAYFARAIESALMDTNLNRAIGRELKAMRTDENLTQARVAGKLGKPQSYVSKLESGERSLRLSEVYDYAAALGIPLDDLTRRVEVCVKDYRKLKKGPLIPPPGDCLCKSR